MFGLTRANTSVLSPLGFVFILLRGRAVGFNDCQFYAFDLTHANEFKHFIAEVRVQRLQVCYHGYVSAIRTKHQYGLAIDVVPVIDSKPQWRNIALWRRVGVIGERLGMQWGGRWRRLFDPGHFEWTGGLDTRTLAQGTFPPIPQAEHYPCLEEDLKALQRHWKAWQIQQSEIARQVTRKSLEKSIAKPVSLEGGD